MDRRASLAALVVLGALVAPRGANAQAPARILFLMPYPQTLRMTASGAFVDAFRAGMSDGRLVEGRDYVIDVRSVSDTPAERDALVREAIASRPAIVVASGGFAASAVLRVGTTLPVVFAHSGDPVEAGLVDSLNRPGRNYTGMTWLSLELVGKRLQMLKELRPQAKRVALIANPTHPGEQQEWGASRDAGAMLGLELFHHRTSNDDELARAFAAIRGQQCEAVDVYPDGFMLTRRERIAEFALRERLPSTSGWSEFVDSGLLASYGVNRTESTRRLASYVVRILRGAAPASLPIETPQTIESIVNMRTARQIGVTVPPAVLARADRVVD